MIFHSHGNTTPFLQERLPISLNFEKMAFCNSKKPNPNRQLKCINICKLIKNIVFGYKKTTTQQKCATYIPTLPQNKLKHNVHSSTTKKSHLTYDEKNSPIFVPNFTHNHITFYSLIILYTDTTT